MKRCGKIKCVNILLTVGGPQLSLLFDCNFAKSKKKSLAKYYYRFYSSRYLMQNSCDTTQQDDNCGLFIPLSIKSNVVTVYSSC